MKQEIDGNYKIKFSPSTCARFYSHKIGNSANMLLFTEEKIIDIATYYRFETQESFTRSFKKYYKLPPRQYRKIMGKLTLQREEFRLKNELTCILVNYSIYYLVIMLEL
ncbi:helix-turn-helix domain-containing protein [Metabacillus halosaccharovorans]|uniref:helix-turn-helix domain-containing protein n=1 Tax=Metabacillus halosaccharovorans TaxID=930124 RepID=UPI0035572F34|nr:hypothetical protein [Metabacillus halosaccharovorans]